MSIVTRVAINSLKPGLTDNLIVGIIISKQRPRRIKKEGMDGQRGVWGITLRDSPEDCINITFWGSLPHIHEIAEIFRIGDIVDVINPKISVRVSNDVFQPCVSSPFQLTMSDSTSRMTHHEGDDSSYFLELRHYPTKQIADVFTIADIYNRGANIENETVDLLVAVRTVDSVRTITTKDGRILVNRTIIVMDFTNNDIPLLLWNENFITMSESWIPRKTVLFLADVKIEWNSYKRTLMAVDRSNTIITEDPHTSEAQSLRDYAWNTPIHTSAIMDRLAKSFVDTSSIRQVMTIRQIQERFKTSSEDNSNSEESHFTALIYCVVTRLDLDGPIPVTMNKCTTCQMAVEEDICRNPECRANFTTQISFDLRASLTDHTGTLNACRLSGETAEKLLKCTAKRFLGLPMYERTRLKWNLLLERCTARVLVLRPSVTQPYPSICLLSCSVSDPTEVSVHVPLY